MGWNVWGVMSCGYVVSIVLPGVEGDAWCANNIDNQSLSMSASPQTLLFLLIKVISRHDLSGKS